MYQIPHPSPCLPNMKKIHFNFRETVNFETTPGPYKFNVSTTSPKVYINCIEKVNFLTTPGAFKMFQLSHCTLFDKFKKIVITIIMKQLNWL